MRSIVQRGVILVGLGVLLLAPVLASAGEIYALNLRTTSGQKLFSFPPTDPGSQTIIKDPIDYPMYAMDFNSAGTMLYGLKNLSATEWELGSISPVTGDYTTIAPVSGIPSTPTGLSVDPTDETFYLSTGSALYELDPMTGVASEIAIFSGGTGTELIIDIAINSAGQLYGHDIGNDGLYAIDKATGVLTFIGAHGLAANFAQGMDFDFATDTLYATIYTGGGTGKFVSWDTATGAITVLADTTPWNMEMEMAVSSPIPEPASVLLLALAGLALRRR
jgi:hypothetical protein